MTLDKKKYCVDTKDAIVPLNTRTRVPREGEGRPPEAGSGNLQNKVQLRQRRRGSSFPILIPLFQVFPSLFPFLPYPVRQCVLILS